MSSQNIKDVYPLSPMQEGILFHSLYAPDAGFYINQIACTLTGLDVAMFERAWQQVVSRHPSLRAAFVWKNLEKPLQVIGEHVRLALEMEDWRGIAQAEQEERCEAFLHDDRQRGFKLSKAPLMRLTLIRTADESYKFIWSHHHILLDGWSLSLLLKEVFLLYESGRRQQDASLPPARPYRDYISWLQQHELSEAEAFWRQNLRGFQTSTLLGIDKSAGSTSNGEESFMEQEVQLTSDITASLQSFARRNQLTLNTLTQGAWSVLLGRHGQADDVLFGVTVSGRPPELSGSESMIGLFINTMPVRVRLRPEARLISWLKENQARQFEAMRYAQSPLVEAQSWSEVARGTPLFDTIFVFENYAVGDATEWGNQSVGISQIRVLERNNYPLAVVATPGTRLSLRIIYDSRRFDASAIKSLLRQFQTLLENLIAQPEQRLADWSLLTESEQHALLAEANQTEANYPLRSCIQHLFQAQAERTPAAIAVICDEAQLTYDELHRRSNQLAHYLQALGVARGTFVAICMEHGVETIVAILGTLKAGGAYVPLEPGHPEERLSFILSDAAVPLILTQQKLAGKFSQAGIKTVCLDSDWNLIARESAACLESVALAEDLAYLIYTSGSTGHPKGVKIQHRALVNYIWWAKEQYLRDEPSGFPLYSSLAFDLTVTSIYVPLITGNSIVIYPPRDHETRLEDILRDDRVQVLKLTPSHLSLIKDRDNRESKLRCLIVGGEAFETELAKQVMQSFGGNIAIYNEYGPTEATVGCMIHRFDPAQDERPFVAIGQPVANTKIYVLDEHLKPVAENVTGELYIGGDGLAEGYLKRDELTAERFVNNPFRPGERMYRSGDLARWIRKGTLEYVGRSDEQVKFHGYRVELNEIKSALNLHPQIRDSIVLLRKDAQGHAMMIAYYASQQEIEPKSLREFLSRSIIRETLPNHFVWLAELPLTLNGKVNHQALPTLEDFKERPRSEYAAPQTPVEEILAGIWAEVLRVERVGAKDNFFELGGHSLLATQMMSRIKAALQVELPLRVLFEEPTPQRLAARIEEEQNAARPPQAAPLQRVVRHSASAPLSLAQQRLWLIDQLGPQSGAYNIAAAVRLRGQLNVPALEKTFNEIIKRHEILRTIFTVERDQPAQIIKPELQLALPVVNLQGLSDSEREVEATRLSAEEAQASFDLTRGPLLRARLLRLSSHEHVLLLTMHHIICDGWSVEVLVHEMSALYAAFASGEPSPLSELPLQYADYAAWQREWMQEGTELATEIAYWRRQLQGIQVLELPRDNPPQPVKDFHGATKPFTLSEDLSSGIRRLSQREGASLFMTLLAAFIALLYRYSGQEDILVGTNVANRKSVETERLIGFFVNQLILRASLSPELSFKQVLGRVRATALEAYAHQHLPFDRLVEELRPTRAPGRPLLFQVKFDLQNAPTPLPELPGLTLEHLDNGHRILRYDLHLLMVDTKHGLTGELMYDPSLFEEQRIERMLTQFETLLLHVVANPEASLKRLIESLVEADKEQGSAEEKEVAEAGLRKLQHVRRKPISSHLVHAQAG